MKLSCKNASLALQTTMVSFMQNSREVCHPFRLLFPAAPRMCTLFLVVVETDNKDGSVLQVLPSGAASSWLLFRDCKCLFLTIQVSLPHLFSFSLVGSLTPHILIRVTVPANLCRSWKAGPPALQCLQLRQTSSDFLTPQTGAVVGAACTNLHSPHKKLYPPSR